MYYTVYKTINLLNCEFYIGVHKTENINDSYFGSGKRLKNSIRKHGIENFKKEILFVYDNEKDMYDKERELVTEDLLLNEKCLNLIQGGLGGFSYINNNGIKKFHGKNHSEETKQLLREKSLNHEHSEETKQLLREIHKKNKENDPNYFEKKRKGGLNRWKNHTKKQYEPPKPRKGRVWCNNGNISKMFHKEDIPNGWNLGRL